METRLGIAGMLALLWIANLAAAAEPAQRAINWQKSEVTVPPEGGTVAVLVLENPAIDHATFAIRGTIKYEQVKSAGYLEMWSVFPDGRRFFTRTLNPSGPMAELSGTSREREFVLPFRSNSGEFPSKLEVNIVLPQGGTASLGPAQIVQPFDLSNISTKPGAWWSARQGGMVGAVLGSVFGVLGAVLGALVATGRFRVLLPLVIVAIAAGVVMLLLSIVALALKQPYAVWYPLLLTGVVGSLVFTSAYLVMKRRLAEQELRRMSAADVAA